MMRRIFDSGPRLCRWTFGLALLALAAGCAAGPQPATSAAPEPAAEAEAEQSPEAAGDAAQAEASSALPAEIFERSAGDRPEIPKVEPPDGHWLVADDGRRYFITEISKVGTMWKREGEDRVRLRYGLVYDVVDETETHFAIKIYEPTARRTTPRAPAEPEPPLPEVDWERSDRQRFSRSDQGLPRSGQWRHGFVFADMNGDGALDLVHGPPRKGASRPQIFLGDGAGNWRLWREARFPAVRMDYGDVAAADFNGDGIADLALAMHLRGMLVMVGDGEGGFELWSEGTGFSTPERDEGPAAFSSRVVEVADWNRDGRPDLISLGEGPQFATGAGTRQFSVGSSGPVVFLNGGDGTWERIDQGTGRGQTFGDALALGDFNGDGVLDIVTATGSAGRKELLHLGREDGTWETTRLEALPPAAYVRALAGADFDGDGREDLAVGYLRRHGDRWYTGIEVLLQRPDGAWASRAVWYEESNAGIWALDAGDLDGDGRVDLAAADGVGKVLAFVGDGSGRFTKESVEQAEVAPGCRSYHVVLADVDGTAGDELASNFAGESGSEIIFGAAPRCPDGGAIAIWDVTPVGGGS